MIFNRFTRDARRIVEAAVEEARNLGHDSVGDEDVLLGVLRVGEGASAETLSSLGVTLEGAREESVALFAGALASIGISLDETRESAGEAFEMRSPGAGRIPFSPRAKKVLEQSLREALGLGDNGITDEHVLRALLRDEHGMAVRVLDGLGISAAEVEGRLDEARNRVP